MELPRRRARHGTRRTLSLLFLAFLVAADPLLLSLSNLTRVLKESLDALRSGRAFSTVVLV